eukprot:CAMPEP_0182865294 /NCGR_PEP_ID=MMETSP0034_2-20130328/7613_1 /TAXON_ID=156128 /ORGANISM="Nephroselmis pyriformis, Strain CCMP717" /LENGTH=750 /DNA_ID=CAMNT_0024997589 /DNA_START=87 /DNA_END=2339 /DNA_ORIENTATION=-
MSQVIISSAGRVAHVRASATATDARAKAAPSSARKPVIKQFAGFRGVSAPKAAATLAGALQAGAPRAPARGLVATRAAGKQALNAERAVSVRELGSGITAIRETTNDQVRMDIEYSQKKGTTDNSYVIRGTSANVLLDVPELAFVAGFLQTLPQVLPLDQLDVLVLGHISPKRVAAVEQIIRSRSASAPPLKIVCSNPAASAIRDTITEDSMAEIESRFEVVIVRANANATLDIGGRVLTFSLTPTPRWPDSMCTYDPLSQTLFSNKLFCAHVSDEGNINALDGAGWEGIGSDWQYYYDCLLAPCARQVQATLDKLDIEVVPKTLPKPVTDFIDDNVVAGDIAFLKKFFGGKKEGGKDSSAEAMAKAEVEAAAASEAAAAAAVKGKLTVSSIAPSHGPVVAYSLNELVREYRAWTAKYIANVEEYSVAVVYASAYGNTTAMADGIARGLSKAGVGVEACNCEFSTSEEINLLVNRSAGFVVGSPTLGGHMPTPVQSALGTILSNNEARGLPCGVFGSFGWSGEAVDEMEERLKNAGFGMAFDPIRCKFTPDEQMMQICEESGVDLAEAVKKMTRKRMTNRTKRVRPVVNEEDATAVAMGRILGSLCVLTTKDGEASSAMIASWVSQASFDPPGVTIAVKKDRAVESLLLKGNAFNLNVLAEGRTNEVFKQLGRQFAPGEDRFEGMDVTLSPNTECVVMPMALSYLECRVADRMETGDHWVVYANVEDGKLINPNDTGLTAIHHRKTGAAY